METEVQGQVSNGHRASTQSQVSSALNTRLSTNRDFGGLLLENGAKEDGYTPVTSQVSSKFLGRAAKRGSLASSSKEFKSRVKSVYSGRGTLPKQSIGSFKRPKDPRAWSAFTGWVIS